jgi:ribose transport system permease protein
MRPRLLRGFATVGPLPPLLILMVAFFAVANPTFIKGDNLLSVSEQGVFLLLIALGQMLVLVSGGFDLSVGTNVALTSIVSATVMSAVYGDTPAFAQDSITAGFFTCIVMGLVVGVVNGVGVAFLNVNPFIVTLASSSVFAGITLLISGGQEVSGLPRTFVYEIGSGSLGGVPVPVLLTVPVVVVLYIVLTRTRYGRHLFAIGGNATAARVAGVRVRANLLVTYMVCAVVTSYAGWLLTARVASGQPLLGGQFALQSITAAVIGGASLRGGRGGVGGTLLGVIFIMVLTNGMNLMRLGSNQQSIAVGLALLFAVVSDRLRTRARSRLASTEAPQ